MIIFLVLAFLVTLFRFSIRNVLWSINICFGPEPLALDITSLGDKVPVMKRSDITDVAAVYVADPFLFFDGTQWHMYFEILKLLGCKGVIGHAVSSDGIVWRYDKVVLEEGFHLSYPYVFSDGCSVYMIPESRESGTVRLYKAIEFPDKWELAHVILKGDYSDPSILWYDGLWWLFVQRSGSEMALFYSERLTGSWNEHPESPIVAHDTVSSRPGGRIVDFDGKIIRFSQIAYPNYGAEVKAYQITSLTIDKYQEIDMEMCPQVKASGFGWNSHGMHTVDIHKINDDKYIASVDGLGVGDRVFSIKYGFDVIMYHVHKIACRFKSIGCK